MTAATDRYLRYLASERAARRLYTALADLTSGERREALFELAGIEAKHAAHWESLLAEAGAAIPPDDESLEPDDEALLQRARSLSLDAVLPDLEQAERDAQGMYDDEPAALPGMADDERTHERVLRGLQTGTPPPRVAAATDELTGSESGEAFGEAVAGTAERAAGEAAHGLHGSTAEGEHPATPAARAARAREVKPRTPGEVRERLNRAEPWHRTDKSGSLRAAVFGASDGLVSNTALVMGFAGSGLSQGTVLLAGVAGLLAGAFSMAAGEYVSVASQRDVFRRELALEAQELRENPQEEQRELELLYRAKGMDKATARQAAARIMADPDVALDTLAREELGLDPSDLGSPIKVAFSSFAAFAVGAIVPVIPYLIASATTALILAIVLAGAALLAVGGTVGALSGLGVVRSALRQLAVGAGAAAITYVLGGLVGTGLG